MIDFGLLFGGLTLLPGDFRMTSGGLLGGGEYHISPAQPP